MSNPDIKTAGLCYRPMAVADYAAVRAFWATNEGVYQHNDYTETPQGFARVLARNPELSTVVLQGDTLIATCLCSHDGRRGWLHHLAVHPAYRRRGIACTLANAAIANLRAQGILTVKLGLLKNNIAGQRFWQKIGFAKEDYYDTYAHTCEVQ